MPLRARGVVLAALVAAGAIALQYERHRDSIGALSRFDLPAFDPWVYVAMAEQPSVFAVAPWGYRVLTPWVVHALPTRTVVRGYRFVLAAGFAGAGVLLFLYLRRLGHGELPSLAAVGAFLLSGPVSECMTTVIVAEPLSILLLLAFLVALEAGAGVAVLALLAALLAYSKEIWVLLLPLVALEYRRLGAARALAAVAAVGAPALAVTRLLRDWWAPHIQPPSAPLDIELVSAALAQLRVAWSQTWPPALLGGLLPLALLGALRRQARPYVLRGGAMAAATYALAFAAWLYVPSPTPVPLFGPNVRRLLLYALPFLLPLALHAVDLVLPHFAPPQPRAPRAKPFATLAAWAAVAGCLAFPFLALDRYRRVPLHGFRDGPYVLTLCRESLKAARKLEAGREVRWSLEDPGSAGVGETLATPDLRWFLREGWRGPAHATPGPAEMAADAAALLLPSLAAAPREIELVLQAGADARVLVDVNGVPVADLRLPTGLASRAVLVPASALFRGDNVLTLRRAGGPAPRLHGYGIRPAG